MIQNVIAATDGNTKNLLIVELSWRSTNWVALSHAADLSAKIAVSGSATSCDCSCNLISSFPYFVSRQSVLQMWLNTVIFSFSVYIWRFLDVGYLSFEFILYQIVFMGRNFPKTLSFQPRTLNIQPRFNTRNALPLLCEHQLTLPVLESDRWAKNVYSKSRIDSILGKSVLFRAPISVRHRQSPTRRS